MLPHVRLAGRTTIEGLAVRHRVMCRRECGVRHALLVVLLLVVGSVRSAAAQDGGPTWREITDYPNFANACVAKVTGYAPRPDGNRELFPVWGHSQGDCNNSGRRPLIFSATQENARNTHLGAANDRPGIRAYMGDFNYEADFGRWLNVQLVGPASARVVALALDTVNFHKTNVTGWPLQYGHMFVGLDDLSVTASLNKPIDVEFDIRVRASEVRRDLYRGYSGHRIMLGAVARWKEASPRTNTAHFIEVDFMQSPDYAQSYGDSQYPLCGDARYDRCFYDPEGKYPEGREIGYSASSQAARVLANDMGWNHIRIPIAKEIRRLHWVSPPAAWSAATLHGLYIGIESEGATRTWIELRHYRVSAQLNHDSLHF